VGAGFSTVTPSAQSATAVAQAVWSYTPRSLTDIQNLVNAIQNNDPSLLSTLSDILYVPAPFFAGQVSATQVAAFLDNLVLNYGLAGPVAAAIAASPYGLWSTNFVTQILPYLSATSVAQVLVSGQMDANHAQLILYWLAQNYYYNKWVNAVTLNATSSLTFSTSITLSTNVIIAQNITIASGVTVTCGTTTCFFVAQSFNNQGTVVSPHGAPGGTPPASEAGIGGAGGGGIVVIAITAALGTLNANGNGGGGGGAPTAGISGNKGTSALFFLLSGMTVPEGGTGALDPGAAGYNGGGGGGTAYSGGAGGGNTVNYFASANDMLTYIMQGLSDWWQIKVLGRSPGSVTPLAYMYGSGGGSGSANGNASYGGGGGGGGGGGEIVVYAYNVVSGNLSAAGGGGGVAVIACGGGGGGGFVFLLYGATSGSVTVNVAGGVGGSSSDAVAGMTGAPGTAYIAAVTVNG